MIHKKGFAEIIIESLISTKEIDTRDKINKLFDIVVREEFNCDFSSIESESEIKISNRGEIE
jgi:hypothetical protein